MTLIEVVVALAIASVVFATVFLIYRTTAATAVRQRENGRITFAPAETFAALQQDVASLIPAGIETNRELRLATQTAPDSGPLSEISFCAWRVDASMKDGTWADAEKISWHVENPGTRDARLARVFSALTGPKAATPATNFFLPGIAGFFLQLHDGTQWLDAWPPPQTGENKTARPKSMRVQISIRDSAAVTNWSTDFIMPIGLVATSRVERISAKAGRNP